MVIRGRMIMQISAASEAVRLTRLCNLIDLLFQVILFYYSKLIHSLKIILANLKLLTGLKLTFFFLLCKSTFAEHTKQNNNPLVLEIIAFFFFFLG